MAKALEDGLLGGKYTEFEMIQTISTIANDALEFSYNQHGNDDKGNPYKLGHPMAYGFDMSPTWILPLRNVPVVRMTERPR